MKMSVSKRVILVVASLICASNTFAKDFLVKTQSEYQKAVEQLKAGDKVILANGNWTDFEMRFHGKGTESAPIELTAETKGQVFITGLSNLSLAGEHLVVSGLIFQDGYTPTREVISFRQGKDRLANHTRVTEVVINNFNNPEKFAGDQWVALYGKYNRFDHNALIGKRTSGVTMAVRLKSEDSRENHHQIDHNYFGPRPILGSNGGETLRIGTSHYSLSDSLTKIHHNYFDRANGEVEIISNKSGKNEITDNVFFESRGTLTLRHGNGNIVKNNVFFGNGVDHTGGIRVINADQVIENNYMEGLTGYRFGSGFTIMNGVPNSPINRYHQVKNANINNNSIINVDHIHFGAGSDAERSAAPIDSSFKNNLIANNKASDGITLFDDVSGVQFKSNVTLNVKKHTIAGGFENQPFDLKRAANGLLYPSHTAIKAGVSRDLKPVSRADVGPKWFKKPAFDTEFDSGKTIKVAAKPGALFKAVNDADSGDIILLEAGHHVVQKTLSLAKVLTFKGLAPNVSLSFERKTLFVLEDGGNLKLVNLVIDGSEAPDSAGNTLIRNTRLPTIKNFRLELDKVTVKNLDVNHSFHVFDSGYRAFADEIKITNSHFANITGDILRLNKEQDDLGIYNAEYIILENNTFTDVQGTLANVYRGGTDESTFGPHFEMHNNTLTNVGNGKRNKSNAVFTLHGVQVANVTHNVIDNAPAIIINHTVGEPITKVIGNQFKQSSAPKVAELHAKTEPTATLKNNTFN